MLALRKRKLLTPPPSRTPHPTGQFAGAQRDAQGRFLNPGGERALRPIRGMLRSRLEGGGTAWPHRIVDPAYPQPPKTVPAGHVAVTFVGHSTFLLRFAGGPTLLTDPIWSERCSPVQFAGPRRVRAPGLAFEKLPRIDAILLSHSHYDHCDIPTLQRLQHRDQPQIVTGLGNAALLARKGMRDVLELDWWQDAPLPHGARATFLPARHVAARSPQDFARTLWGAFGVQTASGRLCFLGDTAYGTHLAEIGRHAGPFGVALIPIGAYEPRWFMRMMHMDPEDAVQAARAIRARRSVAMHFGTFRLTREPIDEPPVKLAAARAAAGLREEEFVVPGFGETLVLPL